MNKSDIIKSFKDSLFTGVIALALFGPIVGLRTVSKGEVFLLLQNRIVFLLVGLCILGSFLINLNSSRKSEIKILNKITSKLTEVTENRAKHLQLQEYYLQLCFRFYLSLIGILWM